MSQSINLIPQEERKEQVKTELLRVSTIITIILLVVTSCVAGFYYYRTSTTEKSIIDYESRIESLRSQINALADIEIIARDLDLRKSSLVDLISNRNNYSLLLEEVQRRSPQTVVLDDFNVGAGNVLTISGSADNYLSVAGYINNLNNVNYEQSPEELKKLFKKITLNSVNLNEAQANVDFFITVEFDPILLKRPL